MEKSEMLTINKNFWETVASKFFGVEALPEYGPFTVTEDEINLFDEIHNKNVLEVGCGSGQVDDGIRSLREARVAGAYHLSGRDDSECRSEDWTRCD